MASALCDTPTGKSDDEGGRASCRVLCDDVCGLCVIRPRGGATRVGERATVCCVTMYVSACTYCLLDVADACRNRHCHDYM